jgi:hypothetical protein
MTTTFHSEMAAKIVPTELRRGSYDEILGWGETHRPAVSAATVLRFFAPCLVEAYVDFDRKGRGDSLNHDLYSYCPTEGVAIVQTRHAFRRRANGYLNVHKSYFLVGFNELTGSPFRHPVSAHAVRAAVRKHGADQCGIIRACQAWMFQVSEVALAKSTRQGDVLATPVGAMPSWLERVPGIEASIDTHRVVGLTIARDPTSPTVLWVQNPCITHDREQHAPVFLEGLYLISLAREAKAWDFSRRMGD